MTALSAAGSTPGIGDLAALDAVAGDGKHLRVGHPREPDPLDRTSQGWHREPGDRRGAIGSDGLPWTVKGQPLTGDVWPLPAEAFAHPRSAGTFTRFLRDYVRERNKISLLEALRRMTLIPAQILEESVPQLRQKGRLQVGADADLVVFDPATVSERGTYAKPNQTAVGMRYVIVSGMPVIRDGSLVREALPGRAIRKDVAIR